MVSLYNLHEYIDNSGLIRIGQAPRDVPEGTIVINALNEDGLNKIECITRMHLVNKLEEESSPPPLVSLTGENNDMLE